MLTHSFQISLDTKERTKNLIHSMLYGILDKDLRNMSKEWHQDALSPPINPAIGGHFVCINCLRALRTVSGKFFLFFAPPFSNYFY